VYFIMVKMLPLSQLEALGVTAPDTAYREQIPDGTYLPGDASKEQREAVAREYVLDIRRLVMRDRMPLPELKAHRYYGEGESIWISVPVRNGKGWGPRLQEIYNDRDIRPFFFVIDGKEYDSRLRFGPFDGHGMKFLLPDELHVSADDFHLSTGRHTVACGWRDLDVVDPNDPDDPVRFARLMTDPVEFDVVEEVPKDYYRPVYREGWEEVLRQGIEPCFTDDHHKGVPGALLGLKVHDLPCDIAFAIHLQAEGSDEQPHAKDLALPAGRHNYRMGCDFRVEELNWDTVQDRRWRIILKPSVDVAKRHPPIRAFYAKEFVTDWLTFEPSPQFEQHKAYALRERPQHYGGTITTDRPVDLDRLSRRWNGQGEAWPLPEGFELGWSRADGGTLRVDPDSHVRLLWLSEANARLVDVTAASRERLAELPQSRTMKVVPPEDEPTLIAVLSNEGRVYWVRASKVDETWANLSWWEDREATTALDGTARAADVEAQPLVFRGLTLSGTPFTSDSRELPDLFEERPAGSRSFEIRSEVSVPYAGLDGTVYFVASKLVFYVQCDPAGSSTMTYYGPFQGDPVEMLSLDPNLERFDAARGAGNRSGRARGTADRGTRVATSTNRGKPAAKLPNGVAVELVALWQGATHEDRVWWRPNGTSVSEEDVQRLNAAARAPGWTNPEWQFEYGYLVRYNPWDGISIETDVAVGDRMSVGYPRDGRLSAALVVSDSRDRESGLPDTGDIYVAVAYGPSQRVVWRPSFDEPGEVWLEGLSRSVLL
jgi:hypothetical protein